MKPVKLSPQLKKLSPIVRIDEYTVKVRWFRLIFISTVFLIMLLAYSNEGQAAQDTTVINDHVPVYSEPVTNSKILEYLAVGSEVRVSNAPLPGGWYKIRVKTGVYGWVQDKNLSVNKLETKKKKDEPQIPKPERDRIWYIRGGGAFNFFSPSDLNDIFQFGELNNGYSVGGELGVFISKLLAIGFRFEAIVKNLVASESTTGITFNAAIRSYPTMFGFDFYFAKLPALRVSVGAFGGVAFGTSFSTEAINLSIPNTFVIEDKAYTSLVRVNLTRPLGRILSIYIEGGYRYLRTDEISTVNAAYTNGGVVYLKQGEYKSRVIDLSGFEAAMGLGFHF